MKKVSTLVIAMAVSVITFAQTTWNVDPSHSNVNFSVSHLVISEVDGAFKTFSGSLISNSEDFSNAVFNFEIDANSIHTNNEKRDGHLKAEDFFYTEKYPKIIFKSTSFTKAKGNKYVLKGDITMRGVTKAITFDVKYGGTAKDGYGNTKAGFIIKGQLNRVDFGVAWNAKTERGGLTVGEEIDLVVKLQFVKK
ncbi:MAG: YceI family protein [Flavobacteriaceae bacterium]|nr:YceI family protein [Flavobacteriaceae bacterium]